MNIYSGENINNINNNIYKLIKNTNFNDYSKYNNRDYYNLINENFREYSFPENYSELTFEEICKASDYTLKQQQKFAGKIFNTSVDNKGVLIYHGLGSGKTQTSIVIAEAFKHKTVDNQIIPNRAASYILIVVPASLTEQYFNELIGTYFNKKINSASGEILIFGKKQYYLDTDVIDALNTRYTQLESLNKTLFKLKESAIELDKIYSTENKIVEVNNAIRIIKNQGEKNVKKVYEIVSHDTFLNGLFKGPQFIEDKYIQRLKINNGLLIIDEAHRLVSALGTNYRKLLFALKFHTVELYRTVLLTGSPIYDKPYEFGLLLNLLRPRIPFPDGPDAFNEYFIENNQLKNEELFKTMTSGYVSYFKGGNPNAYPYKKIILFKHPMGNFQYTKYKKVLLNEIKKDKELTGQFGKNYDDFMYKMATKESKNNEESVSVYNNARLYCNIAFPELKESPELKGVSQTKRKMFSKELLESFKKVLTNEFKSGGQKEVLTYLGEYSSKFVKVIQLSEISEGPVFIYSNYVTYGVEPLSIILSVLGYTNYTGKPGPKTYFIWKGGLDKSLVESAKKIFNSESNSDGSKIKIILGTQSTMEGVDFKRTRQVHIIDPWWNDSRIQQIMARAIRLCSHSALPENKRITDVFIHLSSLGNSLPYYKVLLKSGKEVTSNMVPTKNMLFQVTKLKIINNQLMDTKQLNEYFSNDQIEEYQSLGDSELFGVIGSWKGLNINSVEEYMYLKSIQKLKINRQFERVIKSVSIDCTLNKYGNIIRLDERYEPLTNSLWNVVYENYSSGTKYKRKGLRSVFNTALPENIFTLADILTHTAKNYPVYVFESANGEIITTNKSLIISEEIECESVDYSFNKIPEELKNKTINNSMIPELMNLDIRIIKNYLKNIMDSGINNELNKKLVKFIKQSDYSEKLSLIKKLTALGIGDDNTPWELTDIDELRILYLTNK